MARTQRSIQAFARVSKPTSDVASPRKRKQIEENEQSISPTSAKKQKFELQTPPDTPTSGVKNILSTLKLSVPTPSILRSSKRKRAATPEVETPPTPDSNDELDAIYEDAPEEIDDLKALNASFLKALALHYAHNGVATPVDVRVLNPTITKTWGKRKVLLDDVRLCLGISHQSERQSSTTFNISNYGHGKFCIEMESRQRKRGVLARAFDENELRDIFDDQVEKLWKAWATKSEVDDFLAGLPRVQITECSSFTKLKPALAKGQQRLEDMLKPRSETASSPQRPQYRHFPAYEKPSSQQTEEAEPRSSMGSMSDKENITPPPPTVSFRALSLLDRIQEKQKTQVENMLNKPTQAQIKRISALQRSEEVIQILELLATTKGPGMRASFPLPSLIRNIQNSMKSQISAEEIERCIVVIGKEVAPGYVEKKEFGSMRGVIVNRMFKPDTAKVKEIVDSASL